MKKIFTLLFAILLTLSVCGCGASKTESDMDSMPSDRTLSSNELSTESSRIAKEEAMHISFPEVGLENVVLCEASEREVRLEGSVCGQVFLLGKHKNDNDDVMMDHFLVIVTEDRTFYKDLQDYKGQINFAGNIEVKDFDGDGDCEILLQQTVGMTGGEGSYLSRIFDFRNGEILEILSSDSIFDKYSNNMGFSCTLLKNKEIKIENKFTDYIETFSMSDRPDEYFKRWYRTDGSVAEDELCVDSFYEFVPADTDFDGVYEVFCRQYTSLLNHSDGIGCTKIVLKYNVTTEEFEIINTGFELYKYAH